MQSKYVLAYYCLSSLASSFLIENPQPKKHPWSGFPLAAPWWNHLQIPSQSHRCPRFPHTPPQSPFIQQQQQTHKQKDDNLFRSSISHGRYSKRICVNVFILYIFAVAWMLANLSAIIRIPIAVFSASNKDYLCGQHLMENWCSLSLILYIPKNLNTKDISSFSASARSF